MNVLASWTSSIKEDSEREEGGMGWGRGGGDKERRNEVAPETKIRDFRGWSE